MFISNITFDKSIAIEQPKGLFRFLDPKTYLIPDGVYLLSIHKGKSLIFPKDENQMISLLHIENLKKLATIFNKELSNIQNLSSELPVKKYIDMENAINNDNTLNQPQKEERIKEIQFEFYNILNDWKITINNSKKLITAVKLSFFVNIIKQIISDNCVINLLDYSCNSPSVYIPEQDLIKLKYSLNKDDIETGYVTRTKYGGNKTHKHIRKRKYNVKKHKKKYINKTHRRK
jgi:hypothetical protein